MHQALLYRTVSDNFLVLQVRKKLVLLNDNGHAILVIDNNLDALMKLADRHCIMENGRVVWRDVTAELAGEEFLKAH